MMHCFRLAGICVVALLLLGSRPDAVCMGAQEAEKDSPYDSIDWQAGPCIAKLANLATINVPEGYGFTGKEGTIQFLELNQNPTSGTELGLILSQNGDWFVVFEFDESGHVKDDEKDSLDADAILAGIREGTEAANKIRQSKGWAPMHIQGWQHRPYYDPVTHNLTWSIKAVSDDAEVLNHSIRLLGREGVMHADVVADPMDIDSAVAAFDGMLKSYTFNPGFRYSEYRKGDKLAAYGLTALIAGGAGAVAAKSGLLAKFWKIILAGILFAGGAIVKFFKTVFSRGVENPSRVSGQE
ncbi:MAG: DUF2167 domain-containing protein [Acidobacteria bacterium]|nr:DUF2167 domain-containing protein [Acidobacteriota bacterium]